MQRHLAPVVVGLLTACGGVITERLSTTPAELTTSSTSLNLAAVPSFADERGGGLFVDLAGRVVRLRADGSRAALESHPQNPFPPGPASSIWPLGPFTALVVTDRGLFIADSGWLIAPPWQGRLSADGFISSATGLDDLAWIAHRDGLFRVQGGALQELKANGAPITGLTGLAVAPAPDLRPAVWFARGTTVSVAVQSGAAAFSIRDSGLPPADLAQGVTGMAGLDPVGASPGELWIATPRLLLQHTPSGWRRSELGRAPRQLRSGGRFVWLQLGDELARYDADAKTWLRAQGLETVPTLLAVDATGSAWVRSGASTLSVSLGLPLRLTGLFQNQVVYEPEAALQVVAPKALPFESLAWRFDDDEPRAVDVTKGQPGAPPLQDLTFYSLAGVEPSGRVRVVSFAALSDGPHTLRLSARTSSGLQTERTVHFDLEASARVQVSFSRDLKPLAAARCDKCHGAGTEPELKTYEQWKANAAAVAAAVRDRRMPADGPLDAAGIQLIQRWASGGTLP